MDHERLGDDALHAHTRIERGVRVLKHDLHVTADAAQVASREPKQVAATKADLAGGGLDEPERASPRRGLAAAGFADQRQRLAGCDRKAHVVYRAERAACAEEVPAERILLDEVPDLEQRRHRGVERGGSRDCGCRGGASRPAPGMHVRRCRVYGERGEVKIRPTGPSSTTRPPCMTATRSAISATTPRSCVMSRSGQLHRLSHLAQEVENLRLYRGVERGRRFVGDEQPRLGRDGERDHGALLESAAELMRVVAGASRWALACGPASSSATARSRAARPRARPCADSVSSIWYPIV